MSKLWDDDGVIRSKTIVVVTIGTCSQDEVGRFRTADVDLSRLSAHSLDDNRTQDDIIYR